MIPRLLDESNGISAAVSGMGTAIPDVVSCVVNESLNGAYTVVLKLPTNSKHYAALQGGAVIKVKANDHDGEQAFRIIGEKGEPVNGIGTFTGNHISYDLSKALVTPFAVTGAAAAIAALNNPQYKSGGAAFTLYTDISNSTTGFKNEILQSVRQMLGGQSGSLLDCFGGEYLFDNLDVKLLSHRGENRGYRIEYGKNLTDYRQERNLQNIFTAARAFAKMEDELAVLSDPVTIIQTDEPKYKAVDFSDRFEPGDEITTTILNTMLNTYIQNNDLTTPKVNIKVSFVNLKDTEEYKDIQHLESVGMGDTVTVDFWKYPGMTAAAKVIEYEYDSLLEVYNSIEIGNVKSTLASTISGMNATIKENAKKTQSFVSDMIDHQTEIITGVTGGSVVLVRDVSGKPYEMLFLDTDSVSTAQNVLRINNSGIGFSQNGVSGPFSTAWTIDGSFNASFITAGTINAIDIIGSLITGSEIQSASGDILLKIVSSVLSLAYNGNYRAALFNSGAMGCLSVYDGTVANITDYPSDGFRANFLPSGVNVHKGTANPLYQLSFSGTNQDGVALVLRDPATGTMISYIQLAADGSIDIRTLAANAGDITVRNGNHKMILTATAAKLTNEATNSEISLDDTDGLSIYVNGTGYTGLTFVNDGNGHAVLGKGV